ncbi:MAG: DUF6316 family protein [Pseudomonadales bacterium]|jgi:hypothetical protein
MSQIAQHRAGETGHYPFRSERLYFSGDAWYFLIRGGGSKGPYSTAQDAKDALNGYVETLKQLHEVFHRPTEDDHHHHS